jgi:hypothetical protein
MKNKIHVENLKTALSISIELLKKSESVHGPNFCSALRAGLTNNLESLHAGEELVIVYK